MQSKIEVRETFEIECKGQLQAALEIGIVGLSGLI
jgi:hypothetical protein